jgi:signal peptidase
MDEITLKNLIIDIKKEVLKKGFILTLPTVGMSMFPFIRNKDKVVVVDCHKETLKCGDLILFQSDGNNTTVVHRLMRRIKSNDGYLLITKGDARIRYDMPINSGMVIGKIAKVKKKYFTISLDCAAGRTINLFMVLISLTRFIPFGLITLRKISHLLKLPTPE